MTSGSVAIGQRGSKAAPFDRRQLARRAALLAAILISGGLLLFPRIPLLAIVLVICFFYKSPARLLRREFALVWLLLAFVGAMALFAGGSIQLEMMAIRYANFVAGLALLLLYIDAKPATLAGDMVPILRFMSVQAILTPIVAVLLGDYFATLSVADTNYRTFFLIFTYHDMTAAAGWYKRPDGFFFEPGVLQLYLNLYVAISLFVLRLRWRDVLLGVVGVIATLSTTGAVILAVQLTIAYAGRVKVEGGAHRQFVAVLLAPLLLLPPALYAIQNVDDKLTGAGRGSAWARQYDLMTGLAVAAEHPVTGIGFDYERYYEIASRVGYKETALSAHNITERSNSNGIATLFYSVGFPLGLVFLFGLFRQRFIRPRIVMAFLLILSLSTEALFFTPFVLMLIFSGLLIAPAARAVSQSVRRGAAFARA